MNVEKIRMRFKYYRQLNTEKDAVIELLQQQIEDVNDDIRYIEQQTHQKVYYAQQEVQRARNDAEVAASQVRHERLQREDENRRRRLGMRIY
jgi:hypothetical protein